MEKEKLNLLDDKDFSYGIDKLAIQLVNMNVQTIMMGSLKEGEGKTTIANHVMQSLQTMHKNVCLVSIDNHQDQTEFVDLKAYFDGEMTLNELLELKPHKIQITFKNSKELLSLISSDAFSLLLEKLPNHFDFIILDAPSFEIEVNSYLLAQKSKNVVLILEENKNSKKDLQKLVVDLKQNHVQILGVVLNKKGLYKSIS